ncbi:phage tail length tape measure family protein [Paracoccus methylovorus]|uniref:Phage tail length tape measure family protein n=1 Tax=Paracoccus methylovorus TaxID=2812658 RepID=A0ABX7JNI7_9RHOB|nr:phage tail length tape measure family protein [Paracoccus methylovorus]QRZ15797.1 phage tail length tape measure family protein [Paracoccus methylovorus]
MGVTTQQEADRLLALREKNSGSVGSGSGAAAAMAGNLSFQMNDVAMMTVMGQSPMMVMIQQGPQVAQIFSQIQASGMSMGTALASAFRMMLTPWGLLAIGVIGGGAAIAQGMMRIIPRAKSLEEWMDALSTEFERWKEISAISAASSVDLARDFGEGAEAAQGLYAVLAGLSRLALDEKLKKPALRCVK